MSSSLVNVDSSPTKMTDKNPDLPTNCKLVPTPFNPVLNDLEDDEDAMGQIEGGGDTEDETGEQQIESAKRGRKSNLELADMIVQAAKSGRKSNIISSTLSQLRLDDMKLHGREDDMKLLKAKLLELKKGKDGKTTRTRRSTIGGEQKLPQLVLVSGVSGTGKSALVMKGVRDPAQKMGITYAGGKFDLNNTSMPLSAFVDAMVSLTKIIVQGGKEKKIQDGIKDSFGEQDMMLLIQALPGCEALFHKASHNDEKEAKKLVGKEAIARLQYAIRGLLKIICTHLESVVLFIDDLQSISLDSDIPSLLMIGAYREDEVPDTHPLALQIREKEQMGIELTAIKIGSLALSNVTSLVTEALRMEDNEEAVIPLAKAVHKKTEGNAFFVLMFLRSLHEEQLLQFNFGAMRWVWDDDVVNKRFATENVATILTNKLKRLHWGTQNYLKVASCLGAKFSKSAVTAISGNLSQAEIRRLSSVNIGEITNTESESDDDDKLSEFDKSLHELEEEGLWEKESEDVFNFSHDKIQSAAYELIHPNKRNSFRGEIGNILMSKLDPDTLEDNLFEVVSLRNCAMATISDKEERKELANMNLRAGIKASQNAAFDSSAVYFRAGRELLGSEGWGIDPSTMLKLCSELTTACFICGDLDTMHELILEVLGQDIPVVDKFSVYEVKIQAAFAACEFNEAIVTAFDFRRQIGLPTLKNKPKNQLIIIKEFTKTKRALGNRTAEDIASLPELTDERIIMGQRMLEFVLSSTKQSQPTVFPLIVFLMVRASLKYGINASSCDAFSCFGICLCVLGKPQEGKEMSKAVDLILAKPGMDRMKSASIFKCEGMIHHWTAPLHGTLGHLLDGYQSGLRTGDVESAANNLIFRAFHLYYAGRPLEGLQTEFRASIDFMEQLNQTQAKLYTRTYLLMVTEFRGDNVKENEMDLKGIQKLAEESGNQTVRAKAILARLELSVFFQQWDVATKLLTEAGDLRSCLEGFFATTRFTFFEALISIHVAQTATTPWPQKRKWKKRALKSINMIRGLVKKGNLNLVHSLHLLEAELAALKGKNEKAEGNYKSAITVASRNGFMQDRALSHELASAYYAGHDDGYWKDYHMERCQECYLEWGATAKVGQLAARGE